MQTVMSSIRRYLETMRKNSNKHNKSKTIQNKLKHFSRNFIIKMNIVNERANEVKYMPTNILP